VKRVICDIECNRLYNPDTIWCIVCRNIDNEDEVVTFIKPQEKPEEFAKWAEQVELWVGHNFIDYDKPVMERLLGISIPLNRILDTLVTSRLLHYGRKGGHS
jgi:hypothetical protein